MRLLHAKGSVVDWLEQLTLGFCLLFLVGFCFFLILLMNLMSVMVNCSNLFLDSPSLHLICIH